MSQVPRTPALRASASRALVFEHLSLREGLSQSIVECVVLDRRGFLWLGTEDGLNRFDGYEFKAFRHATDDPKSLSYSEVKCLLEAPSGELWVGTFAGLNLFDPATETCRRFVHDPEDSTSLGADVVRALCHDRSGKLWIGTQGGGLDRFDPETGRFEHHRHDPSDPTSLAHDDVRSLALDGEGRLWIGTSAGLDRLEGESGRFEHYRHDPEDPKSLSHDEVSVVWCDQRGGLWVGTRGGSLDHLGEAHTGFDHLYSGAGPGGLGPGPVSDISEDALGRLWIAHDGGGLDALDLETGRVIHHRHDPRDPTSPSTDRLLSCRHDGAGVLWVGSYGGGLDKGDPRRVRFLHYRCHPDDPESLSHPIVWSICEARDGSLWVGTDGGLDHVDRESGRVEHFLPEPGDPDSLAHPGVRVVYEGPSGRLWVGTNGGLHLLDRETGRFERFLPDSENPSSLSHGEIRSLYEDSAGALWVGTLGGGLDRLDPATGRFHHHRHDPDDPESLGSDYVRPVYEDDEGFLWIGTQGGGLDCLDPRTGRCRHFRHDPDDPTTLSSDHVFAIWEDAAGQFWLGTYAGGLDRFDRRTGRVRRFGEADGLPTNLIYGIVGDQAGRLWISSNKGLTRFDPRRESFRTYDSRDGLQSDEFNGGSYHHGSRGELFFGGINGFNVFFPADLEDSRFEPEVVITDFQLSGRSLAPGEEIAGRVPLELSAPFAREVSLDYRDRVFSFQFTALDFSNPPKNRYAYRMAGFDRDWRTTDASRRFATYTNLPPGKYRFEVRGTNCDGVWSSRRAAIRIEIAPPIWGTWWFRTLAAGAATALALRSYRRRVRTIRLETELSAAREAQRSIWPRGDPRLPGFEISGSSLPASEVGGDFFDYVWLGEGRLALAIGDVAGKGMSAAMTAVLSSGMVAAKLGEGKSLEEALRSINRFAFHKRSGRKFTALCLASISAPERELRWANAGLPEPMLKRGDAVVSLATPDPRYPLGIHAEEAYREMRCDLRLGDVLLFYTDGVPEAFGPEYEPYGYGALADHLTRLETGALSARQIAAAIFAEVRQATADSAPYDDMTIVVVKAVAAEKHDVA